MFWLNLWEECGCSSEGSIADIRRKNRRNYYNTIVNTLKKIIKKIEVRSLSYGNSKTF